MIIVKEMVVIDRIPTHFNAKLKTTARVNIYAERERKIDGPQLF